MKRTLTLLVLLVVAFAAAASAESGPRYPGDEYWPGYETDPAWVDPHPAGTVPTKTYDWTREMRRRWKLELRRRHNREAEIRRLRRLVTRQQSPTILHSIRVAATVYGVDRATLERKARCESVNFTDFYNEGSRASGVMQFLPSTWATTPFARFSIFDHLANVMAGAWMHSVGRGGEWECR